MDAVKYIKEKQRMCTSYEECMDCGLYEGKDKEAMDCYTYCTECPEEVVAIVEKWAEEHPRKTFLSDLLEKHPKAMLRKSGIPSFCPVNLGYGVELCYYELEHDCVACWNRPLEE